VYQSLRYFLVLSLLATYVVVSPSMVRAAPIVVTNGDVTALIAAIDAVNSSPSGGVVELAVNGDYVLTTAHNTSDGATGLPVIIGNVTIEGNGATIRRSDAAGTPGFRILRVATGGDAHLSGLTIANGSNAGYYGGGIDNSGTLTVTNSTVTSNKIIGINASPFGVGGGIHNSGTLTITNSTISDNSAPSFGYGGGIHNSGMLTVASSTISGNTAADIGGGITNGGTLTVTNSTINGNRSGGGGGIQNSGAATVTSSTISGNTAADSGGDIWHSGTGTLTVTNSTITGNTAADSGLGGVAGGIWNSGTGTLSVTSSTISGNSASAGGGIYNSNTGTLTVTNSTISSNSAPYGGGGFNQGTLTVTNSTISGNSATWSGGIYNHNVGTLTITSSIINGIDNCTDSGGSVTDGGYNISSDDTCGFSGTSMSSINPLLGPLADNGGPTLTHAPGYFSLAIDAIPLGSNGCGALITTDQRGVSRPQGTACDIGAVEGWVTLTTSVTNGDVLGLIAAIIAANSSPTGGVVVLAANGDYELTAVHNASLWGENGLPVITGNVTIQGNGATIRRSDAAGIPEFRILDVASSGVLHLNGVTIANGFSFPFTEIGGGGIYNDGHLTITNSTFSGNSSWGGGGIFNAGFLSITNGMFRENSSSEGGAILNSGTLTITNSTVSDNEAELGGGIYHFFGKLTLANTTLKDNRAPLGAGGGIFIDGTFGDTTLEVTNSTLSGNSALGGGGISSTAGIVTVTNSTFSGNSAAMFGGGIHNDGTMTLTHSTVEDNKAMQGGGGIFNYGMIELTNSTISGNMANSGGGIDSRGTLVVTASTVSGNTAATGGGIWNGGTGTLTNSTVSGNRVTVAGGGIDNSGTLTVTNSTVNANVIFSFGTGYINTSGGGIRNTSSDRVTLINSIVANNWSGGDCSGNIADGGYNISSDDSCGFSIQRDPTSLWNTDPLLGPLADNGGPTQTHALLRGSPAIDFVPVGTNGCGDTLLIDQRGVSRPQGMQCDAGALEVEAAVDHTNPVKAGDCMQGGWASYGFRNQGQCIQFVNSGKKR
jgi:hypothetical protein